MKDLSFAIRQLKKSPGFTFLAIATLALGIGMNTAIFSVVDAVLLKPLPFPQPEQLLAMGMTKPQLKSPHDLMSLSYPDFFDYREQNRSLSSVAVYREEPFALSSSEGASSVGGVKVSADFLDVLRIKPTMGRNFSRSDEQAGGGPGGLKVVLSHEFWQGHFGADPNVIGRTIELNRRQHTVIGVMPAGFQFPIQSDSIDFYVTIAEDASTADGSKPQTQERGSHGLEALARMKPGVTAAQAQSDLARIATALEKQYPDSNTNISVGIQPLREEMVGDVRTALYVLFGAVVCVLLIANANVANLLLARASVRGREMALRAAMGASRMRIIRQLLTESLLLSVIGGVLALFIAEWGTEALVKTIPENIPRISAIHLDPAVLAFTLLVSLATGVVFGLVPAWQASRVDLNSSLKSGTRTGGAGEGKGRVRNALIMAEVALALVLLICAGLLIQSFARLGNVPPGFRTEHLLTARVALPDASYPKNGNIIAFYDQFLARVRALPGVESASVIIPLPLTGSNMTTTFDDTDHPLPQGQRPGAPVRVIGTDYFVTMGIPVRGGRAFDERDRMESAPVVIVNERFAAKYFAGKNVLGKRITPGFSADDTGDKVREIVGVVGNVKHLSLQSEDSPEMYLPRAQMPFSFMALVVRTTVSNPSSLTSAIRNELGALDKTIPLTNVHVFDDYLASSLARPRFNALLISIFAATALVLTAIGIYGVMAYSVTQRTHEIGIRIALGAAKSSIFRLVVGQAMILVGISVAIGLAGALAATRLLNSLLFGVSAWDPATFFSLVVLVSLVAFLAAWLPARRATNVDPIVALRAD